MPLTDEFDVQLQQTSPQKQQWKFEEDDGSQVSDLLENDVFSPLLIEKYIVPGLKVVNDSEIRHLDELLKFECDENQRTTNSD